MEPTEMTNYEQAQAILDDLQRKKIDTISAASAAIAYALLALADAVVAKTEM